MTKMTTGNKPKYLNQECTSCHVFMAHVVKFDTGKGGGIADLWQCVKCKNVQVSFGK